jgi:hypothetical protein
MPPFLPSFSVLLVLHTHAAAIAASQLRSPRATEDVPSLISAATAAVSFSDASPCPPGLPWACAQGAVQLTLAGSLFGSAPGSGGGVDLAAAVAPPAPAPLPADFPDALQLSDPDNEAFAWAAGGGCLRPSDAASVDFSIEVCPYTTSYLRARGGGARLASLGAFAGVVRRNVTDCNDDDNPPGTFGVTGLLFAGGDACGANGTRSAQVNFVCSSAADPWASRYLVNASVSAASASPDGCAWQLDVPLASACSGEFYGLCSTNPSPPPNAAPAPAPFTFSSAFIAAWTSSSITVLAPPGAGVRAVRVRRYDGVASALVAPLPAPLPPSASPIPLPFPSALTVLSVTPAAGLSFSTGAAPAGFRSEPPCSNGPVSISLGGVQPADLEGPEAGFEAIFPRGPAFSIDKNLYGSPLGASGAVTRVPANGRLDLVLPCAPFTLDGFPTPFTGQFTVRSRFRAPNGTLLTRRVAACAPGACAWTFLGPTPPAPAPAPAADALAGPALYGAIGGGLGFIALVAAGVAAYCCCWMKQSKGKSAAAPTPPRVAWASGAAIELNPVAVALKSADGVQDWSPK